MHNYVVKCLANTWLYGFILAYVYRTFINKQIYVLYKANIREDECMCTEIENI